MKKHGEKWAHSNLNTRNSFSKITASMKKITTVLNAHGERIKNEYYECILLTKEESGENSMLCNRSKKTKEDCLMNK